MDKFQVEGPKILTKLEFDTRETAKFVIWFWKRKWALLLLTVKVTFCILPAVIWIGEFEDKEGFAEARYRMPLLVIEEG